MDKFLRQTYFFVFTLLIPFLGRAQEDTLRSPSHSDSLVQKSNSTRPRPLLKTKTLVTGKIIDSRNGSGLPFATISFPGTSVGVNSGQDGSFSIETRETYSQLRVSLVGYKELNLTIIPGQVQILNLKLESNINTLKAVVVKSDKKKRYRNKNNPAVSLIQQIIDHKDQNKMQSMDYLQYVQNEKIEFSLFNLSQRFLNRKGFQKYRFLIDTTKIINEEKAITLPVYLGEKSFDIFLRRDPPKTIKILKAHREVNFSAFIDTAGLDIYLNRLYSTADIYENNIFILTNQFLSPIADHSPNFYKYFITDTLDEGKEKLLEVSFIPRNQESLLFEGKLNITMDGTYAVKSIDFKIGRKLNLNFVRSLHLHQDFEKHSDGRYFLEKSKVESDFGLLKSSGFGIIGERTILFKNYKAHIALPDTFYNGQADQIVADAEKSNSDFMERDKPDTLSEALDKTYHNLDSLRSMSSFKKLVGITTFITGGYGVVGPIQVKPLDATYSFNSLEGSRITLGGRTTPAINKTLYLEDYLAYGFKDERFKFYSSMVVSLNQVAPYKYPNNYFRISYLSDTDIPGQNFLIDKTQSFLRSFSRGHSDFWQYNQFLTLNYIKEFINHITLSAAIKVGAIQPAENLVFQPVDHTLPPVLDFRVGEFSLGFRYAPNEQIFQGTNRRRSIPSKYPIINVKLDYGIKGLYQNQYSYLNTSASIYKRFYLSQLGYSDITVLGGYVFGQVPYPLLDILPANQTYVFDKNEYNTMNFLEFITDHYIGINIAHNFGGFFLNKVPLLQRLHFREIVSLKLVEGGLGDKNDPVLHPGLYGFAVNSSGVPVSFPLGDTPFIEGSLGLGNILKVFRLDIVERFNYLDNPNVYRFGVRFSFTPDF